MSVKDYLTNTALEIAQNPKAAAGVAAATTAAGSILDTVPDSMLTKIATILGIILTTLLIIIHTVNFIRSFRAKEDKE